MEVERIIFLTTIEKKIKEGINFFDFEVVFVKTKDQLLSLNLSKNDILLSHNTSVIVPETVINKVFWAFNVHSASPEFPGRDPHHWAIYRGAKEYGATLHFMESKVDSGKIIKVKSFKVIKSDTPLTLLKKSNETSLELINWLIKKINEGSPIIKSSDKWGETKSKRSDFTEICDVTNLQSSEDFHKILKSFSVKGKKNIYMTKFGRKFYLEE